MTRSYTPDDLTSVDSSSEVAEQPSELFPATPETTPPTSPRCSWIGHAPWQNLMAAFQLGANKMDENVARQPSDTNQSIASETVPQGEISEAETILEAQC